MGETLDREPINLTGGITGVQIRLNTLQNARKTMGRLIQARARGRVTDTDYKSLVYGLSHLLGFFRLETETAIQEKLSDLEMMISERIDRIDGGAK